MKLATRVTALLLIVLVALPAGAATFTKIADAATLGPGWTPANTYFGAPALDTGVVAFSAGDNSTGAAGIYTGSGGALTTVADNTTLVPGNTFAWFYDPSISAGNVAFVANDAAFYPAVYTTLGGTLTRIAQIGMPDPDGSGTLQPAAGSVSIDGPNVAFLAHHEAGYSGLYTRVAGAFEVTADETTPVPGGDGTLYLYGPPSLDATGVAFEAFSGPVAGIYVASGGVARVVADTTTPVPGGTGTFLDFSGIIASDDGNVVFEAFASNGGLYAEIGGVLMLISDELIQGASIHGDDVAWYGSSDVLLGNPDWYSGLYAQIDGQRVTVIEVSDVLDGRVVSYFGFGPEALSGDELAFTAYFEDGTSGVYLATIPEPGTGLLLAAGLAALAASRRGMR